MATAQLTLDVTLWKMGRGDEDARPATPAEIAAHVHIVPQNNAGGFVMRCDPGYFFEVE